MADDHYVSRFLTTPWEVGQRRLTYYDFAAGTFDDCSSESLFAEDGLHSEEAGKVLSALVETPAASYRAEILRGSALGNPSGDWKVYRALVAMVWLQVARDPRSRIGTPPDNPFTLDGLCRQREDLLDLMGRTSVERYPLIGVALPPSAAPLYLTEVAYFPIPMVGTPPILAIPLTPRHFIATPEKGFPGDGLSQWLSHPVALSAFSIGFGSVDRVVIPPELVEAKKANPLSFQRMLNEQRENAEELFNLVAQANRLVGFQS